MKLLLGGAAAVQILSWPWRTPVANWLDMLFAGMVDLLLNAGSMLLIVGTADRENYEELVSN